MLDSLEKRIKADATKVSAEEIVQTIKIAANLTPYLAGGAGLLLGGVGMNAMNKRDEQAAKQEENAKALLVGLAGAGAGFFAGNLKNFSGNEQGLTNPDEEFTQADMNDIFGR